LSPLLASMSARARFALVTLAALAMALLTARLGLWQLDRAAEKTAMQEAIEQRQQQSALHGAAVLPSEASQAAALHHRRIELSGRWADMHTVYLDNRQMDGRPGFFVVTPLLLDDGRALLVQRGWIARDSTERTRIELPAAPAGRVTVAGRIAPAPARLYEFGGDAAGRIRQNLDIDAFARETGLRLVPLSLLQTPPVSPADGLRREWPVPASGVSKHHGYAFQWFGLSVLVVVLYVWFQFIQPRRPRSR
jgi:surfeit locus 1 family protein